MFGMGAREMQSLPHSPPPTPDPTIEQISDDSTFNVLQLNANRIGKTTMELQGNKVQVAVIQELKL